MSPAIEQDTILKRVNGIQGEVDQLRKLGNVPIEQFKTGLEYPAAQLHLHRALEGVFNISSHILSRIPGGQATKYSEIALKMGEHKIVDSGFAENTLVKMAKYRNRLVHFYAEVTAEEIYGIIQNNLGDFDIFLSAIKYLLQNPKQFGLTIE